MAVAAVRRRLAEETATVPGQTEVAQPQRRRFDLLRYDVTAEHLHPRASSGGQRGGERAALRRSHERRGVRLDLVGPVAQDRCLDPAPAQHRRPHEGITESPQQVPGVVEVGADPLPLAQPAGGDGEVTERQAPEQPNGVTEQDIAPGVPGGDEFGDVQVAVVHAATGPNRSVATCRTELRRG